MAGAAHRPLSVEQAKARLRAAAREASPLGWVSRHPAQALALAIAAGFLVARLPAAGVGQALMQVLAPREVRAAARRQR